MGFVQTGRLRAVAVKARKLGLAGSNRIAESVPGSGSHGVGFFRPQRHRCCGGEDSRGHRARMQHPRCDTRFQESARQGWQRPADFAAYVK